MTTVFKSTEARPMPGRSTGPVAWLRSNLFSSLGNSLMSLALDESKRDLENKVAERTRDLLASRNEALRADADKRKLIQKVNEIIEDERKSIAVEIHDELNASLIAARLGATRLIDNAPMTVWR